jgi:hypothetical protein
MATNGITPPTNERPNYFAGQYLLEDDFQLEQQYHRDRQRWHHHLLHVSGIAEGLKVTKVEGDLAVNVSEGSAIDPQGQQITLLAPQKVDLTKAIDSSNSATLNGSYTLYIGYSEQKTDQQTAGNEITSRRWQEEPQFKLSSSELKDFISLAKLTITNGVVSDKIDNSVRVYSGLRLPTLDGGIALSSKNDGTKSLAELKGSLSIAGTLSVTDNVGIGMPPNSVAKLQVKIDGATTTASLKLEHNGSNFIVRPASAGGNSSVIENTGGFLSINPNGGNVGIGTVNPQASLEIDRGTTNNLALSLRSSGQGWGSGLQFINTGTLDGKAAKTYGIYSGNDGKLHFADVAAQADRLVVDRDGNVGIGTNTPRGFQIVLPESSKSSSLPSAGVTIAGGASGNASIELRNAGTGTPYIDFAQNATTTDYDARIRLTEPGKLSIEGANVGIGTTTPGSKLSISASENHLLLRREKTETTGGKLLFLELYQDDPDVAVPEVCPSIRFHHYRRYFHRIEARGNGFHFKNGDLKDDGYIDIYARNVVSCVETLQMIRGTVGADGSGLAGIGFKGFTVTKNSTGLYTITFSTAFSFVPTVVATQQYPANNDFVDVVQDTKDNAVIVGVDTTKCQVKCGNGDGKVADRRFHFIAIGPR